MERTKALPVVSPAEFLADAFDFYIEKGFSLALWRLPAASTFHLAGTDQLQQLVDVNVEESTPGFIFSPFQPSAPKVFLPADEYYTCSEDSLSTTSGKFVEQLLAATAQGKKKSSGSYHKRKIDRADEPGKAFFLDLVDQCRLEVANGRFEKIVPSRSKSIALPETFRVVDTFLKICNQYPNAMVSVFSSPLTGTWMGATPEMLVSVDRNQRFRTVAVAGTQQFNAGVDLRSVTWTQKDIEEQALVERYIISCFKKIRLREFDEHGPRTVLAGNILHLKTEFDVDMVATNFPQLGSVMLNLLHPTSAVCGMPMADSLHFLSEREKYDRQYYSGYLGPLNVNEESHLYVNLRCMQLFSQEATLFAGAGVMSDSDPEKEWQETEMKMNTLLKIIRE